MIIGERSGEVNFFKRNSDGTLNATIKLKTARGNPVGMSSNAAPAVVDWNGDGTFDILIGSETVNSNGGGLVKVFINNGTPQKYRFAEGEFITTNDGQRIIDMERICIQALDLNNDKKPDLIVGEGWKSAARFLFYENIGTATEPSLKKPVALKKTDGIDIGVYLDGKPCFGDLNHDGALDCVAAGEGNRYGIDLYYGDVVTPITSHFENVSNHSNFIASYSKGQCRIVFTLETKSDILVNLISADGQLIKRHNIADLNSGNHAINFNVSELSSGIYFLHSIINKMQTEKRQILIIK